jgi:hypothetical protein
MARIIVMTISDNDEAEQFARAMLEAERTDWPLVPACTTIDAMIARPTLGCKCGLGKRGKQVGWTRAPRFGWFIHSLCRRPSPYVVRDFVSNMLGGCRNLLVELDPEGNFAQPRNHKESPSKLAV